MRLLPVQSSMFIAIGYRPDAHQLIVQYSPEVYYQYENVPPDKVVRILFADSHGKAFNALVKSDPKAHPYRRLAEKEVAELGRGS